MHRIFIIKLLSAKLSKLKRREIFPDCEKIRNDNSNEVKNNDISAEEYISALDLTLSDSMKYFMKDVSIPKV